MVAGGSLGGLTAALVLRDLGCEVDIDERSPQELQARGAGIVVLDETLRYLRDRARVEDDEISIATTTLRYLGSDGSVVYEAPKRYRYSSWGTIYRALLERFPAERYHLDREVADFENDPGHGVRLLLSDGVEQRCDLLVCADGIGSAARSRLLPDSLPVPAGYVAWRGTVAESELDPATLATFSEALVYQVIHASHILVYPIPNIDGSTTPGRRMLNFVWYRNYTGDAFEALMTDRDGQRHVATVPPGSVAPAQVSEVRAHAAASLSPQMAAVVTGAHDPFVQAIFDVEVPKMAFGQICLIGDAAFALRPHIAAGTAKAAADGWALAEALEAAQGALEPALATWEVRQLRLGRAALHRARRNGQRSQFEGTWVPGDPELAFGLMEPSRS